MPRFQSSSLDVYYKSHRVSRNLPHQDHVLHVWESLSPPDLGVVTAPWDVDLHELLKQDVLNDQQKIEILVGVCRGT